MPRRPVNSQMLDELLDQLVAGAKRNGWTQAELATRAAIRPETLSRVRGGCQFDTLERLASATGMRIIAVPESPNRHLIDILTGGPF